MQAVYEDSMGSDLRVVNAARVSFANRSWYVNEEYIPNLNHRRFYEWDQYAEKCRETGDKLLSLDDYSLIHYLAEHKHWTPFAHPHITLIMQAPVPIRTQCFKHKQGFVENEESRRYIKSTPKLFIPDEFRSAPENAKQGSGGVHPESAFWKDQYTKYAEHSILLYEAMIADGVAPEQARFILPQGVEVEWYWTGSLAAFARFCKQRLDPHAQLEIRQLAHQVSQHIRPLFPVSWAALMK